MSENKLALELQMERLNHQLESVTKIFPALAELAKGSQDLQEYVTGEITKFALSIRASKLDKDELENFFKHPYHIYKERGDKENEWHLAIPKFVNAQFGWLEKVTESHNIFLINRYVDWLGDIPQSLKNKMGLKDPLDVFLDNGALVGKDINKVAEKYKQFITKKDGDRLVIDKRRHFELLATLIKDGILPFIPKPVDKADLVNRKCEFELRDYQQEGWNQFMKYSNIGAFYPPSTGKTWLSMYALTHVVGPSLVVVPSKLLVEQWAERLEVNTDLKVGWWINESQRKHVFKELEEGRIDVVVTTYQSAVKYGSKYSWKLLIVDEVHHLPSNEFSKLAVLQRKYTIGLSATPQREDGREEYIFALTGKPVGLSWDKLKALGIIQSPPLNVWIVKNETERITQLGRLLQDEKKTIVFCDSIEMGTTVSKRFDIPHVHGESKERLGKIQDSVASVVSRVGDEGISLPDIKRVIEISWLHGSRRQELQRFTRLLHGKTNDGEGHIIMTASEYHTDHKRLFGIMDKGFKIILHREGVSEKIVQRTEEPSNIDRKWKQTLKLQKKYSATPTESKSETTNFESQHPILSLPGIQKKLDKLPKNERAVVNLLFQLSNNSFTTQDMCDKLGVSRSDHLGKMTKLIEMKLIKKVNKTHYQADLGRMHLAGNPS